MLATIPWNTATSHTVISVQTTMQYSPALRVLTGAACRRSDTAARRHTHRTCGRGASPEPRWRCSGAGAAPPRAATRPRDLPPRRSRRPPRPSPARRRRPSRSNLIWQRCTRSTTRRSDQSSSTMWCTVVSRSARRARPKLSSRSRSSEAASSDTPSVYSRASAAVSGWFRTRARHTAPLALDDEGHLAMLRHPPRLQLLAVEARAQHRARVDDGLPRGVDVRGTSSSAPCRSHVIGTRGRGFARDSGTTAILESAFHRSASSASPRPRGDRRSL